MLHIKYQDHRSIGSRDEDFYRLKPYPAYDLDGWNILGMKVALWL